MSNTDPGIIRDFQNNFDSIQKAIHDTADFNSDKKLREPESVHVYLFSRTTWYNRVPRIISPSGTGEVTKYKLNNGKKYDLLTFLALRHTLPAIRVKKEFENEIQICWCKNIAYNAIIHAELLYGEGAIASLNGKSFEVNDAFLSKNDVKNNNSESAGNIQRLQKWNVSLPADTLIVEQPWFFSRDPTLALPLFYCCNNMDFWLHYTYNRNISKLLRMRRLIKNDEEKETKEGFIQKEGDKNYLITECDPKYLWVEGGIENLKDPEMLGMFVKGNDDEIDAYKCWTRENKYGDFYIEDIIPHVSENPSKYDSNLGVELDSDSICHTLVWMAENESATKIGNLSNYSTDTLDASLGYNPIEGTTFKVGSNEYFKDLSTDYTGNLFSRDFPGRSKNSFFNVWSFSSVPTSLNAKVGVNMSRLPSKITVRLKDKNPFLKELNPSNGNVIIIKPESPHFSLHVYLLVTRKISFMADGDNGWKLIVNNPDFRENLGLLDEEEENGN
jgi:hypothetical protein